MKYILNELEPKSVLHFFEELSAVPRGSYNEDKAIEYVVNFAKARGLEVYCDSVKNVYIKKPASKGMEDREPVLFQGHIDMVCEKNISTVHDFKKDGIRIVLDGDYLSAEGTTLGADDGVAIAIMLAILDDDTMVHPPIECLMTVSEEVGLIGAGYVEADKIKSRKMINIDTSVEGTVLVSCSGGRETIMKKVFPQISAEKPFVKIFVGGLRGGHSGMNINEGRGNSNKILGEILLKLSQQQEIYISQFVGGEKSNAIPRESSCIVAVSDKAEAVKQVEDIFKDLKERYKDSDSGININITDAQNQDVFGWEGTETIINLITKTKNGVVEMSREIENLVETSMNLGVVNIKDGKLELIFSLRSASSAGMNSLVDELTTLAADNCEVEITHKGIYPGWEYEKESKLREVFLDCYKELTGKPMNVAAIHCGLECGIIKNKIPKMDIVSCGPNIYDCHTPGERLDIPSLDRLWKLITKVISNL
ncbi:MAG: aminoacyl-histidine dipeptidase [Eubacteriales bacterium]|nr:aminoacyl-histidine dipeptidase [Eubacteriales bacterium]